jgi:intracellular multiplication protein IcmP
MLFLVAIGLLVWLIWHYFRTELLEIVRYVRLLEIWLVALVDSRVHACSTWLRVANVGNAMPTPEAFQATNACFGAENLRRLPPAEALRYYNVTPDSLGVVTDLTTPYVRWIGVLICASFGVYVMYFSPRTKFKTRHTLESFIKVQAKMWPVISPIVNFKPAEYSARSPGMMVPDKLPPFAEALSPEEWLSFHRVPVVNGIPDRETVRRAFMLQLGPPWKGDVGNLPLYLQALFAAFALKGAQKREESDEFLGRLALCWSLEHGFQMESELAAEVKKIIHDPAIGGKACEIANLHAYRTTAILGVLKWARLNGGVLAPAQFLWLRAVDRTLWYPLDNLGRRAFHSEGAGAIAHFMAEQAARRPLPIPRIDTAIVTINQYLAANPVTIPPREDPKATKKM